MQPNRQIDGNNFRSQILIELFFGESNVMQCLETFVLKVKS